MAINDAVSSTSCEGHTASRDGRMVRGYAFRNSIRQPSEPMGSISKNSNNTIGTRAGFTFKLYPHILRHSCGFHLAGRGADAFKIAAYLGHKNIQNSLRYVHASAHGFKHLW